MLNPQQLRLGIAAHLLNGLITHDRNRTLTERVEDLDHSLELTDELFRRCEVAHGPTPKPEPEPSASADIREEILMPHPGMLPGLLAERRSRAKGDGTAPKPRPRGLQ